ncbi:MAG: MerR family transcriptional regulator [Candidatus Nanopelagicales bacterium]
MGATQTADTDHVVDAAEPDVAISVAEAAARVGLTAATLRTWHRRYGLAPSVRTAGGHRRYSASDIARLRAVQQMVAGGVPPAEAVSACLDQSPEALRRMSADEFRDEHPRPRAGGGQVLPLPDGDDDQRGLARAADSLDAPAITRTVMALFDRHGVIPAWEGVVVPVLVALGERWRQTNRGVEIEHVASDAVIAALQAHGETAESSRRPVLLACVPDEQHTLPLFALQAALRDAGQSSVLLGARVPPDAIHAAVRRLRPRAVVLWAQRRELADPELLTGMPTQRPAVQVVPAGPGWSELDLPETDRPHSLSEAVDMITGAA